MLATSNLVHNLRARCPQVPDATRTHPRHCLNLPTRFPLKAMVVAVAGGSVGKIGSTRHRGHRLSCDRRWCMFSTIENELVYFYYYWICLYASVYRIYTTNINHYHTMVTNGYPPGPHCKDGRGRSRSETAVSTIADSSRISDRSSMHTMDHGI